MKKLILILLVGAVPAGAWMFLGTPAVREEVREPASAAGPGQTTTPAYAPRAGQKYSYQFRRQILLAGFRSSIPPLNYEGKMELDVIESNASGFTALMREQVKGQAPTTMALKIHADPRGEKVEVFGRLAITEEDRQHESVLKDLVAQFFFSLKQDTAGEFESKIEMLPPENGENRWRKAKLSYKNLTTKLKILSSLHTMKWNQEHSLPHEVKGHDATRMGEGESSLSAQAGYALDFLGAGASSTRENASALAELQQPTTLFLNPGKPSFRQNPEFAQLDWAEIIHRLTQVGTKSDSERLKLFGDIVKLLQENPARANELIQMLRAEGGLKKGASSPLFQTVVGALATAGTSESQAALREIYADAEVPFSGRGSVFTALTTTQAPADQATLDFLTQEMKQKESDLAFGAAFALGASLEKITDPNEAAGPIAQVLAAWEIAKSGPLPGQLALLDVMGNSGRAEFLPTLTSVIQSSTVSELRAKAVFSLRFINPGKSLLASSLQDADHNVRTASVTAIGFAIWSETFRAPIQSCAESESVSQIKSACAQVRANAPTTVAQN
jgi:hypothetical protein